MKTVTFLTLLSFSLHGFAKEFSIDLSKIPIQIYNEVIKRRLPSDMTFHTTTGYSKKNQVGEIKICINVTLSEACFKLDKELRQKIIEMAIKFKGWEKKASAKSDSFEKEIGTILTDQSYFLMGQELYLGAATHFKISFHFFTSSPKKYHLVISFPKIVAYENQFISHNATDAYLNLQSVNTLIETLNEEALSKKVNAFYEKKSKLDNEYK
jgi:hypothetical protein